MYTVLFILWPWYGNLFSGPGKVLVLVLKEKVLSWSWSWLKSLGLGLGLGLEKIWRSWSWSWDPESWSWSWSWQKSLIYITARSPHGAVPLSMRALNIWRDTPTVRMEAPGHFRVSMSLTHWRGGTPYRIGRTDWWWKTHVRCQRVITLCPGPLGGALRDDAVWRLSVCREHWA